MTKERYVRLGNQLINEGDIVRDRARNLAVIGACKLCLDYDVDGPCGESVSQHRARYLLREAQQVVWC